MTCRRVPRTCGRCSHRCERTPWEPAAGQLSLCFWVQAALGDTPGPGVGCDRRVPARGGIRGARPSTGEGQGRACDPHRRPGRRLPVASAVPPAASYARCLRSLLHFPVPCPLFRSFLNFLSFLPELGHRVLCPGSSAISWLRAVLGVMKWIRSKEPLLVLGWKSKELVDGMGEAVPPPPLSDRAGFEASLPSQGL